MSAVRGSPNRARVALTTVEGYCRESVEYLVTEIDQINADISAAMGPRRGIDSGDIRSQFPIAKKVVLIS